MIIIVVGGVVVIRVDVNTYFNYLQKQFGLGTGNDERVARDIMRFVCRVYHIQKWPIHRRSSCFLFQIEF